MMTDAGDTLYTYRAGRRILLEKQPDQFVVRALPQDLTPLGFPDAERVSPSSSRVTVRRPDLEPSMSRARETATAHHAYQMQESGQEFLITDRVLVTFKHAPSAEEMDTFLARYALQVIKAYSDQEFLFQLTNDTGMNPIKLIVKLNEGEEIVETAEHDLNQRMRKLQINIPTEPFYLAQWHLHGRSEERDFDPRASTRCEAAWQTLDSFGSPDVVVGFTDDGCQLTHPDFDSPGKFAAWGYMRGSRLITPGSIGANPAEMYQPGADHGTACAGVIGSEVDGLLTVGAAPGCRLLPIKWESDGPQVFISDSKLLDVLDYLKDKVDILSNSWGSAPTSSWSLQVVQRIDRLSRTGGRRRKGIIFVWAAGNENCPIQHQTDVDVPYTNGWERQPNGSVVWAGVETSRTFINNLVGLDGVVHVAALASNARRSHYSNYGTGITLCAPTSNSHAYFRMRLPGLGIVTAEGVTAENPSGVTRSFGGTSSAAPLVAGIAALVISANPELTALEVISILKRTASKDLSMAGYDPTPAAPFNSDTSWDISPISPFQSGAFTDINNPDGTWSPWFGFGRVDAERAVATAQARLRRRSSVEVEGRDLGDTTEGPERPPAFYMDSSGSELR